MIIEYRPKLLRRIQEVFMKNKMTRGIAGVVLCLLMVTSAFAAQNLVTASCGGTLYTGNAEYSDPYPCSLSHSNCMVMPIFYTTVGSSTETYHFHAAYHSGTGSTYDYCPY